ncbi:hypothetical protein ACFZAB_23425 [Streptomyces albogriseolus]|uniref:hypothetical protein n=1 Tax=Streptomyces albogriseolus TaxID=1887 RepID=UPI00346058CC
MPTSGTLAYDVFVADPIPQNVTEPVPNGDRRMFSPLSVTLVHGERDAVLVDPPLTTAQAGGGLGGGLRQESDPHLRDPWPR